jgi:hypothetical protein
MTTTEARTDSDDPTFDAVWTKMRGSDVDVAYDVLDTLRTLAVDLTPAVCQIILPLLRTGEHHNDIVNAVLNHLDSTKETTMPTVQYDSGLPDTDTTLADQIADQGLPAVAAGIVQASGSSVVEDASAWDAVDALLQAFDKHADPAWSDNDHNELIARASRKYFGAHNPRHVTMIPIGPSKRADWDEDSVVYVYERDNGECRALLTRPTGEYREFTRSDGSTGEVSIRHISRYAVFADRDVTDEWVRDLRLALRDAQDDHLADFADDPATADDPLADFA